MNYQTRKTLTIALMVVAIIGIISLLGFLAWKGFAIIGKQNNTIKNNKNLIENIKKEAQDGDNTSKVIDIVKTNNESTSTEEIIKAVVIANDSNPINLETGKVLTRNGQNEADNSAPDSSDSAPIQSNKVNPEELPESVIKLIFSSTEVSPNIFTVKAGQAVSISVTATDFMEVFKFQDSSLSAVVIGLMKGDTRVISFNAPEKKGEYTFYSDVPGRYSLTGKMIVE